MANVTGTFYAASGSVHGYGAEIQVGNGGSPETFQAVAGVVSITPGDMTTADILRTHLRSPDAHQEHAPGLRDSGAFTCEAILLPGDDSQTNAGGGTGSFTGGGLVKMWTDRTIHNFKIVLNDGSPDNEFPFTGYVSQYQLGAIGNDDVIRVTVGFQPTQSYSAQLP